MRRYACPMKGRDILDVVRSVSEKMSNDHDTGRCPIGLAVRINALEGVARYMKNPRRITDT